MEGVHFHKTSVADPETLFDRVTWFYALCREWFFRDDTEQIIQTLTSRLFMMLDRKEDATGEIFRVLRPGGVFFLAEPLTPFRAQIPLAIMRSLGWLMSFFGEAKTYDNNVQVHVLTPRAFSDLVHSEPWERVVQWQSNHYQYAVCSKRDLAAQEIGTERLQQGRSK